MTDIHLNAKVQCSDGNCGESISVILNPKSHKVTHFVLQDKSLPDNDTRIVPVEKVQRVTQGRITLSCSRDDVALMDAFIVTRFIQETGSGTAYASGDAYTSQYVVNDTGYEAVQERNVPTGELAVYNGMQVHASDGAVGKLDELILDPDSGEITHLLMREGHLWGKKDVAVPVEDVRFTDGQTIYLELDKQAVKALPAVPVKQKAA